MTPWERAGLALKLLAIDPQNLGGLVVRARVGPAREALMSAFQALPIPTVRLHPHMSAQVLDGDVDLSATLGKGTLVMQRGLLDRPASIFVLPMAERVDPSMSARLSQALDAGQSHALLALDEGADETEAVPIALSDRAAFHVDLSDVAMADLLPIALPDNLQVLRRAARRVHFADETLEDLVVLAVSLGISSLRTPSFALRAAQTIAALHGRDTVTSEDVRISAALVFAHRATQFPQPPNDAEADQQQPQRDPNETSVTQPDDVLLDAVKAVLPANILADFAERSGQRLTGNGSGAKRSGNRRGRPLPSRQGRKSGGARVDLVATLRAAIPWQTIRKRTSPKHKGPIFRKSDLRQKRYQSLSDRLLIFTVDASGSAAMSRLGEAKGAVEILLAQAYARRDHVALVSYRGAQAEVLLPPTRSLVQTKRRLAAIPGGGATPLAAGLTTAMDVAQTALQKGLEPTIVLLADGRANIALDGRADREQALKDAQKMAAAACRMGIETLVLDTSNRPEKSLSELATHMKARYIPLPRADAQRVSSAISTALAE